MLLLGPPKLPQLELPRLRLANQLRCLQILSLPWLGRVEDTLNVKLPVRWKMSLKLRGDRQRRKRGKRKRL